MYQLTLGVSVNIGDISLHWGYQLTLGVSVNIGCISLHWDISLNWGGGHLGVSVYIVGISLHCIGDVDLRFSTGFIISHEGHIAKGRYLGQFRN